MKMDKPNSMPSVLTIGLKLPEKTKRKMDILPTLGKCFAQEDLEMELTLELKQIIMTEIFSTLASNSKHIAGGLIRHGESAIRFQVV